MMHAQLILLCTNLFTLLVVYSHCVVCTLTQRLPQNAHPSSHLLQR